MPADTSEKGLETILVEGLCARGWKPGKSADYSPAFGLDLVQLRQFLDDTQPELSAQLDLDPSSPAGLKTLSRIQGDITKRGVIEVLRAGVDHGQHHIALFYGTPSKGNAKA